MPRGQHPTPCHPGRRMGPTTGAGVPPAGAALTTRRSSRKTPVRTFVLDTSVLIADPAAFLRFAEHEVILPLVVISELEGKRNHPELGYFARQCLRLLDDLRIANGRLDQPVPVNDTGGTLRVELNHADPAVLPPGFRNDSGDSRILSVARALAAEGKDVTLVSKDMPLRVKAASVGLSADEYRHGQATDPSWSGMAALELTEDELTRLYAGETPDLGAAPGPRWRTRLNVHQAPRP